MSGGRAERFTILGYGRFGAAFADMLRADDAHVRVVDPHAVVPPELAAGDPALAVRSADWVVLAMPVGAMRAALEGIRPLLHPMQIVFDVGSVKERPCAWLEELLGAAVPHAGTHPLFGPLSLARGDQPRRVVLCPSARHPRAARHVRRLFERLDCEVVVRDPGAHDAAMAQTHALTFFIAKALVDLGVGTDLTLAPPSFRGLAGMLDAVRGDAGHLFSAIQRENAHAAAARKALLEELRAIDAALDAQGDPAALAIPAADAPGDG